MSLKNYDNHIKSEYRSLIDNVVQDFYIPLLKEAVTYKRAVGFFSSTALVELSIGIGVMAERGGHIQIVASPHLSSEDIEAIRKGYEDRDRIIEGALLRSLSNPTDYYSMERLNLLASLIAEGILDIKIAYTEDKNGIGMYHEKMGIIEDKERNIVAFSGSMNESLTAMSINYETIDVFCNWKSESDAQRVLLKSNAFCSIWNDSEPKIKVCQFQSISNAIIERYKKSRPRFDIDTEQFKEYIHTDSKLPSHDRDIGARIPNDVKLYDYQKEAISVWAGKNYCGIFNMATGTGKTLTGLGAIAKLSEELGDNLAVIIACPYQHLVEQWVEDIKRFNIDPIIGYSNSYQKNWEKRLAKAVRDQIICQNKTFFCFVCTNATFTKKYVQDKINKIKTPILLVVDEAHNFGASGYKKYLDKRFTYRLALSATLERHNDPEGTDFLLNFFGEECIKYDLRRAINEDKLTPYKYYPVPVYLNSDELVEYERLSSQISKCMIKGNNGQWKLNKQGEILALERSRIVAGAQSKLHALKEVIMPYIDKRNILVYCGTANVREENDEIGESYDGEIRQIDAVTKILGNELGMRVAKYTSQEDIEQRQSIKEQFENSDSKLGLQAIVAIKCLDEGVNIPGIRTAFILASTTNPKEYIQRRGRVLRKAANKSFAEIYDFVTLPRPLDEVRLLTTEQVKRDKTLVKNELIRVKEFCSLAENRRIAKQLIDNIENTYCLSNDMRDGEIKYE